MYLEMATNKKRALGDMDPESPERTTKYLENRLLTLEERINKLEFENKISNKEREVLKLKVATLEFEKDELFNQVENLEIHSRS